MYGELKKPGVNKIVVNHTLTCYSIVIYMLQNKHNKYLHIIDPLPEIIPWISLIIHITYDLLTNTHTLCHVYVVRQNTSLLLLGVLPFH